MLPVNQLPSRLPRQLQRLVMTAAACTTKMTGGFSCSTWGAAGSMICLHAGFTSNWVCSLASMHTCMTFPTPPCCLLCSLQDPFAEKTVYNDGPVDKLFIKLFTQKMADQLEGGS